MVIQNVTQCWIGKERLNVVRYYHVTSVKKSDTFPAFCEKHNFVIFWGTRKKYNDTVLLYAISEFNKTIRSLYQTRKFLRRYAMVSLWLWVQQFYFENNHMCTPMLENCQNLSIYSVKFLIFELMYPSVWNCC